MITKFIRSTAVLAALVALAAPAAAQVGTISGRVTADGSPLSAAQVSVVDVQSGATYGALSDAEGRYTVGNLRAGLYNVTAQSIGYTTQTQTNVAVLAGQTVQLDFALATQALSLSGLEVFASRAVDRKTPVAFTNVEKVQIQNQLASRDLPMVLNVTPSVYASQAGGGAGDARINVRGFSQRNTAVMINGVPVNDMENGWVYWSNWDGLGDASTSIQLQRGLSAVNLATPSIGGTLNVITDPTAQDAGVSLKQEFGNDGFLKTTFTGSTGELGKFALTAVGVRKTGDGVIDGTYTDAWAYYLAASFQANARNRLEFFAVGAPQAHGQRLYALNAATYSHEFARSLDGYDPAALDDFPEAGIKWNPNWAPVSTSYQGKQYASVGPETGTFSRQISNALHERENYFHKPQVNLNWYSYLGNGLNLSTVAYYSGGAGGGSGTMGDEEYDYTYSQRFVDWDETIADNVSAPGQISNAIIRSSVNKQWTLGAISKLRKDFEGGLTAEVGVDWRTAEIDHYRDVRDLLGGVAFACTGANGCGQSDFWGPGDEVVGFGDKIDYYNTNQVDWIGGYLQAEKTSSKGSLFGMAGISQISYDFEDYFAEDPNNAGETLKISSGNLTGYQVKGGGVYNVTDEWSLFTNAGYVSKVPIFDGVIDDGAGVKNPDPTNETFISFEGGLQYRAIGRGLSFDLNFYHTTWRDQTLNRFVRNIDGAGTDGLVNLLGVDSRHMGVELQGAYQPSNLFRVDVAASLGNWKYLDDVSGTYRPDENVQNTVEYNFYIDDLKVGDAPQTQLAYGVTLFPIPGLYFQAVGKTFTNHYAAFNPFSRTDAADRAQSWELPTATVFDLHLSYRIGDALPGLRGGDVRLFANMLNLFDELYVSDATDNSSFNGFDGDHDADDAEIFLGLPRTFNIGVQIIY